MWIFTRQVFVCLLISECRLQEKEESHPQISYIIYNLWGSRRRRWRRHCRDCGGALALKTTTFNNKSCVHAIPPNNNYTPSFAHTLLLLPCKALSLSPKPQLQQRAAVLYVSAQLYLLQTWWRRLDEWMTRRRTNSPSLTHHLPVQCTRAKTARQAVWLAGWLVGQRIATPLVSASGSFCVYISWDRQIQRD